MSDIRHFGKIINKKDTYNGTEITIRLDSAIGHLLNRYMSQTNENDIEIVLKDSRLIRPKQRKMIYATFKDIANHTGYTPEEVKQYMKFLYVVSTGEEYFSLSDCSVRTAKKFTNLLIEFCIRYEIPLSNRAIDRTEDISTYLFYCLAYKKCAVCGKHAEIHHVDKVGMGRNRDEIDHLGMSVIALCREHHIEAEQKGDDWIERTYKVYGIKLTDELRKKLGLGKVNEKTSLYRSKVNTEREAQ